MCLFIPPNASFSYVQSYSVPQFHLMGFAISASSDNKFVAFHNFMVAVHTFFTGICGWPVELKPNLKIGLVVLARHYQTTWLQKRTCLCQMRPKSSSKNDFKLSVSKVQSIFNITQRRHFWMGWWTDFTKTIGEALPTQSRQSYNIHIWRHQYHQCHWIIKRSFYLPVAKMEQIKGQKSLSS